MSIVLGRNNSTDHRIENTGFPTSIPIYKSPEFAIGDQEDFRTSSFTSSSSSSSIGRNSDDSPAGRSSSDGDGEEVQSPFKPGGLDNLNTLEEVLPIKYVDYSFIFFFITVDVLSVRSVSKN